MTTGQNRPPSREALLLLSPKDQSVVAPALAAHGLNPVERPDPGTPPALIIADPALLAPRGWLVPNASMPPLLLKSGPLDRATLATCIELPAFFGLVARDTPHFGASFDHAVRALLSTPPPIAAGPFATRVSGSADRERILQELDVFLTVAGIRSRSVARVVNAVEELITNAVYDAPTDPSGQRLYLETDRREAVSLAPHQHPTLTVDVVDARVTATMVDPFGSLETRAFKTFLARGLRGDFADKAGGAGRGFARIYAAVDSLHVHVVRGRSTAITLRIDAAATRRDPGARPNDLIVVERGPA